MRAWTALALNTCVAAVAVGSTQTAVVKSIVEYGAFCSLTAHGKDGLLHRSQLRLPPDQALSVGERILVRVLGVDGERISLALQGTSLLPSLQPAEQPWTSPPTAEDLERLSCVGLSFSRSSGPGGQAVNKLSTRCEARLDLAASPWPAAVRARLSTRATGGGAIIVTAERQRTQTGNRKDALGKLATIVADAWDPPKVRKQYVGISRAGKRKRRDDKKRVSDKKRDRSAARRGIFDHVSTLLPSWPRRMCRLPTLPLLS